MCTKATLEPGGGEWRRGFEELLFHDTNRKLVKVGGRCLMRKHKCNTMLMSVFLCDRLSAAADSKRQIVHGRRKNINR